MVETANITPEEEARIREDERQRLQQQQQQQQSFWSMFSGFGLGDIFTIGLVLIGAYFFARVSPESFNWLAQQLGPEAELMLGKLGEYLNIPNLGKKPGDLTAEEAKAVVGDSIPKEVMDVVAKDDATYRDFVQQVEQAGGDVQDPISDKVIYQLMINRPQLVRDLVTSMRSKNNGAVNMNDPMTRKVMAAVQTILADPTRVAVLLDAKHRSDTLALVEAVSPLPFAPGKLAAFIEKTGIDANGQPTAELVALISALAANDTGTAAAAALPLLLKADGASIAALVQGIDPATITDPSLQMIVTLAKDPANIDAVLTFYRAMKPEQQAQVMQAAANGGIEAAFTTIADIVVADPALRAPMKTLITTLHTDSLPPAVQTLVTHIQSNLPMIEAGLELKDSGVQVEPILDYVTRNGLPSNAPADAQVDAVAQIDNMIDVLLNGPYRNQIKGAIPTIGKNLEKMAAGADPQTAAMMHFLAKTDANGKYANLEALVYFLDEIGTNSNNHGTNEERTRDVLRVMIKAMVTQGTPGNDVTLEQLLASEELTVQELANFFSDPANAKAFRNLVYNLNQNNTNGELPLLAVLDKYWGSYVPGDQEKSSGYAEILADPKAIQALLDMMKNPQDYQVDSMDDVSAALYWTMGAPGNISDNQEPIKELASILAKANVTGGTTVAVTGNPTVPGGQSGQTASIQ